MVVLPTPPFPVMTMRAPRSFPGRVCSRSFRAAPAIFSRSPRSAMVARTAAPGKDLFPGYPFSPARRAENRNLLLSGRG